MIKGMEQIAATRHLSGDNAVFSLNTHGLLMVSIPELEYDGRAFLNLAFPFERKEEYISVQTEEKEELGMIRALSDFDEKTSQLLRDELAKKYFCPKIRKILKVMERNGSTFWDCLSDQGKLSFTVRDVHRSLVRAGEDRIFVVDIDGCRYEIESISGLDRRSHTKIELYL